MPIYTADQCLGTQVEFYVNGDPWETCKSMDAWFIGETALGRKCRSLICDDGTPMKQFQCPRETRNPPNAHRPPSTPFARCSAALDAFSLIHGNRTRCATGMPITDKSIAQTFCCTAISKYYNMRLTFESVCDCSENCITLAQHWQSMLATVWISYNHDIAFFSDEHCTAETARFRGIDQGTPCASNNYYDGIRADCAKIVNDDAGSLRIIARSHPITANVVAPIAESPVGENSLHQPSPFTTNVIIGLSLLAIGCSVLCFVCLIKGMHSRNAGQFVGLIKV